MAFKQEALRVELPVTVLILSISTLVIFRIFTIGDELFPLLTINSDLIRANLPTYVMLYDSLSQGIHFWSWNMGIGTTMFSHADTYFDPFTYITFLRGRDGIAQMMVWSYIIKLVFEGLSLSLYLRHFKLDYRAIILASVMYSFCGYSMIMGSNLALGTILVYFPIGLLFIEKSFEKKQYFPMILVLIAIAATSYYYFYMSGIIFAIYTTIRTKELRKNIFNNLVWLMICGLLAAMIVMPIMLPQLEMALNSARADSGKDVLFGIHLFIPNISVLLSTIARSFDTSMIGNLTTGYYGPSDYFQNESFVTCLSVPFLLLFILKKKECAKKVLFYALVVIIAVTFPLFSYIFNEFSTINYRWTFIIHILLCIISAYSIDTIIKNEYTFKEIILVLILSSMIALHCVFIISGLNSIEPFDIISSNIYVYLIIILTYCLFGIITCCKKKLSITINHDYINKYCALLLVLVVINVGAAYQSWFGEESNVQHYVNSSFGYDDYSSTIIDELKSEDPSFFRIYKDFDSVYDNNGIPSDNDSMAQNYYGLKCYNSMNNANYIEFLQDLGIYVACLPDYISLRNKGVDPHSFTGANLNYINGIDDRYDLCPYLGVKYIIIKPGSTTLIPPQYYLYYTSDELLVYKTDSSNGLAFINPHYMSTNDFMELSYENRIDSILNYTIVDDLVEENNLGDSSTVSLNYFSSDNIKLTANIVGGQQYVSLSMPYDKYWNAYIDGVKVNTSKINISLMGILVPEGTHTIELKYNPETVYYGLIAFSFGIIIITGLLFYENKKERGMS